MTMLHAILFMRTIEQNYRVQFIQAVLIKTFYAILKRYIENLSWVSRTVQDHNLTALTGDCALQSLFLAPYLKYSFGFFFFFFLIKNQKQECIRMIKVNA